MLDLKVGLPPNHVVREDGVVLIPVQLEVDGPITLAEEDSLFKRWGVTEDSRAQVQWVEYWADVSHVDAPDGRPVHRSAHVFSKSLVVTAEQGNING